MNIEQILKPIQADFEEWYNTRNDYADEEGFENPDGDNKTFYDKHSDFQLGVLHRYFRERWGIEFIPKILLHPIRYYYNIHRWNKENLFWFEGDTLSDTNPLTALKPALIKAVDLVKGEKQ